MKFRPAFKRSMARLAALSLLPAIVAGLAAVSAAAPAAAGAGCQLRSAHGAIQRVIYITFDNTHFTRDNPNVPSDLEQMPNLLNFIKESGTLDSNHHTPLISHTATDILTSLTGVYGDHHGVPVSNSFRYFNPDGTSNLGVAFAYWTDPLFDPTTKTPSDTTPNMLAADGKNAPAPWVPFTRAGCNWGGVATANAVLENATVDIPKVFGAGSPEDVEVKAELAANKNTTKPVADFVGIGVHCSQTSDLCSAAHNGKPDRLMDEPGGYLGFNGLFGNKYVAPQIHPGSPLTDLDGNVLKDAQGNVGFPGFDGMAAATSLSYVAAMQEHGVPVTFAYITDAHDHNPAGLHDRAFGPGEAGYVALLRSYNDAFGKFFARLAADGINKSNTLFVFTSDEGDHFAGGPPTPANCDGATVPCTYSKIGEVNANMAGLLATEKGNTTPFRVHADDAPTVYITGNPARDAAVTRRFERDAGQLTAVSPITGTSETIMQAMADPVEMKILHMVTADPARTPTFTYFANPDYFLFQGAPNCNAPCVTENPAFAWNHGDFQPEIVTTWLGMVGPGVRHLGVTHEIWSDHTDIRPTVLALVGLKDDYAHDGRVLVEALHAGALARSLRSHRDTFLELAETYKQLNASVGSFGLDTLTASTTALKSGDSSADSRYASIETKLASLGGQRDAVATRMKAMLEAAAFDNQPINEDQASDLISRGRSILDAASDLAGAENDD